MVPVWLRRWFVVHFVADWIFALPLFVAPRAFLGLLGWTEVDPVSARLVAAAHFGIGTESLLNRNGTVESFRSMLNLKIIWSATATLASARRWNGEGIDAHRGFSALRRWRLKA